MKRAHCNQARLGLLLGGWILFSAAFATTPPVDERPDEATQMRVAADYGKLPLTFEANQGQADARVRFLARGQGYGLFLTATEAVLSLRAPARDKPSAGQHAAGRTRVQPEKAAVVRMRLAGANKHPQLTGLDPQLGKSNYFIGNDPEKWRRDVPNYARVKYAQVYPGIDLIYYGNQRQLEYDFVVAPGADPRRIELAFKGVDKLSLDREGNLVLAVAHGEIVQHAPVMYQDIDGQRKPVEGQYVLRGKSRVGFRVAGYDPARPLVIDPVLVYSTYLGGSGDEYGSGIAVDASGSAYVTGLTSGNFPTVNPIQANHGGGGGGAFVTKLNAAGNALLYSTYLGGIKYDYGSGIAVDGSGNAYVTGEAGQLNFPGEGARFPTTAGAFQTSNDGGGNDAFVAKLNAAGSALVYSTLLGGAYGTGHGGDAGYGIAVDGIGNAYVTGLTSSSNFPTTAGAFQTTNRGLGYSNAFVTKLNPAGSALVYSTYLGGDNPLNGCSCSDVGYAIAVDGSGNAYVTGQTNLNAFPTTVGAFQPAKAGTSNAFVTKLNPAGSALVYSTYLGGTRSDFGRAIAVDGSGNAYVTGETASPDFPTTADAFQPAQYDYRYDAFVTKLNPAGSALVYSTYLGGNGNDYGYGIAVDSFGNAYVTGRAVSDNFPTVGAIQAANGGSPGSSDAFVAKIDLRRMPDALNLVAGWNLLGNSVNASQDVARAFGNATNVTTVWKWIPATSKWAFYTPTQTDGGVAYAATKGYDFLTTINGGEGFWVNAKQAFTAQLPTGTAITTSDFQDQLTPPNKLPMGWSLIATGDNKTPSAFNRALSVTHPAQGVIPVNVTTLWAWDSALSNWYFYAPSLESSGGLAAYITSKGYLDFTAHGKTLGQGVGFWVNKP